MENQEILTKLENLEILLSTFIQSANDPQKRQKEAEFLNDVRKQTEVLNEEVKGLISEEKRLVEGFNPAVEVRHYSVNVKEPLYWIAGAILAIIIAFGVSFYLYHEKEQYKKESEHKDWNYMKYKYLMLFSDPRTTKELKKFDADYHQNWIDYDKKIIKRERELEEAARAAKQAELKAKEAEVLKQKADSLLQQ